MPSTLRQSLTPIPSPARGRGERREALARLLNE